MDPSTTRRAALAAAGTASTALLAGCSSFGADAATGTLATRVSDRPGDIDDFESCVVTIDTVTVKPADGNGTDTGTGTATGDDNGLETIDAGGATADLVDLQGEKSQLVSEGELDAGDYQWLKLSVSGVDATLAAGDSANVTTPGRAALKFNRSFEIRADTVTRFTADFTPVKAGQSGKYVLQPVAEAVTVSYGEETTTGNESA